MAGIVEILREGTWLYGGSVRCRVRVVRRDWDYHHEPGYDSDPPDVDADGWAYYVEYEYPSTPGQFTSPSQTCLSVEEAVALAESTVAGGVQWGQSVPRA